MLGLGLVLRLGLVLAIGADLGDRLDGLDLCDMLGLVLGAVVLVVGDMAIDQLAQLGELIGQLGMLVNLANRGRVERRLGSFGRGLDGFLEAMCLGALLDLVGDVARDVLGLVDARDSLDHVSRRLDGVLDGSDYDSRVLVLVLVLVSVQMALT